jgi:alkylhydroperoxidase/carboxymuconolactone decarboxylase family protein YurZ
VMGNGKGALYEVIAVRELGVSKAQVLETIRLAALFGGPLGLNPLGELAMEYLAEWRDDPDEPVRWPEDWAPDPAAFRSGIDPSTDELLPGELELVKGWYERSYGETPRHVDSFARWHPKAFKTQQLRFELAPTGALPAQLVALLRLHLGAIRQSPVLVRRATQLARTLGVRRHHVVSTLFWAAVYGGETVLESAHEAAADVIGELR